jgi:hypothetical protein
VGAGVGRPHPRRRVAPGLPALAADRGPLPDPGGHQVQRSELVKAEDDRRFAGLGYHLTVGDRVQVLDPGLLDLVVRVPRRLQAFRR